MRIENGYSPTWTNEVSPIKGSEIARSRDMKSIWVSFTRDHLVCHQRCLLLLLLLSSILVGLFGCFAFAWWWRRQKPCDPFYGKALTYFPLWKHVGDGLAWHPIRHGPFLKKSKKFKTMRNWRSVFISVQLTQTSSY